ncbi:hypothetical protein BCD_0939 (plasmid) [Borrelia crocidurae DOU]|uniref:Uncharacterized protein n=1 Tax=Borrelia crocidurae DOU TaxID=1293575 RepID=W5SJD6_9SPIR|nr:hypothetical protein BCD_0939 [Borrelia crocidurae DOU]
MPNENKQTHKQNKEKEHQEKKLQLLEKKLNDSDLHKQNVS